LGKGSCTFKEADLTRAFKAAKKAGVDAQIEIDLERKRMRIRPMKPGHVNEKNEWDEELFNGKDQIAVR
jgi:hypothetical protein